MTFNNSLDMPFQPAVALEGGPDSQNNIFLRLLKSRVIMLGSDVNDDVANFCGFKPGTHVTAMIYLGHPERQAPSIERPPAKIKLISN